MNYRIVPSKHPYPSKCPPPNFDSFVVFRGSSCNTIHHAKFSRSEPEVGPLSPQLQLFWCTLGDTTSGIKGSYTPVRGLLCSVLRLQHEICVLQVTTERCGNLATRLQVGPLCSTIQLSPLSGWPRWITDEPTIQVHSVLWQLTVHPRWALAWG